jgi:ABC-type antimicrobial peptide transport system permease subunit
MAVLSGFFGGLALLLTAIGLYGVMAYVVTQRTHEIGIRMALGAQPRSILHLVMRDAAIVLVAGIAAGVLGSIWITRLIQQLLFGPHAQRSFDARSRHSRARCRRASRQSQEVFLLRLCQLRVHELLGKSGLSQIHFLCFNRVQTGPCERSHRKTMEELPWATTTMLEHFAWYW